MLEKSYLFYLNIIYLFLHVDFDDGLVLLRYHQTYRVGRSEHIDEEIVGENVKLLYLVPGHVNITRDPVPASN